MASQDRVREFYEVMRGGPPDEGLATDLLDEEYEELIAELEGYGGEDGRVERIAKEAADVLFTLYGACEGLGIDLDRAFELVAASNMTKTPNYTGKIAKGPNYVAPDMRGAIRRG